ncbi:unnamed protein product [Pneumocystis jirovecii]|uniref:Uncharacterized protein n=1 Tax=Pneumocystis jirovecii TaxID=42068 RepID=L0PAC2_PNEJI|nr:unnamed protein product [Pneumocystis jirovecii]CCJ29346.1 unnamed protein product [Pneumocystis jirovecii]
MPKRINTLIIIVIDITETVPSVNKRLSSCNARSTDICVSPSTRIYNFVSPGGTGFPGGYQLPLFVIDVPVDSIIRAIFVRFVTAHPVYSLESGGPDSIVIPERECPCNREVTEPAALRTRSNISSVMFPFALFVCEGVIDAAFGSLLRLDLRDVLVCSAVSIESIFEYS